MASRIVWGVDLRPMQRDALVHVLGSTPPAHKLLLVTRTGSGKSHVTRMLGTMLRGIHLVVRPLLVLAADQVRNFTNASGGCGSVSAVNLDDAGTTEAARDYLVRQLLAVSPQTSRTIFLFASPQYLALAARLIEAVWGGDGLIWQLGRKDAMSPLSEHRYELEDSWAGIVMHKNSSASNRIADANPQLT